MSTEPPRPSRPGRSRLIVGLVVLGIAAIIGLTITLSREDAKPTARAPAPTTVPTTPPTAGSSDAAAELVRLLDAGSKLPFDGSYTAIQDGGGASSTLRLLQKPPLVRLDTESGSGADVRRTAQFALPSGPVSCARQPDLTWTCKAEPGLRLRAGLVPEAIVSQLARFGVEARGERIGGLEARCFSITDAGVTRADVCVGSDGVPLRVLANSVRVELTQLDRTPPPDDIFNPPAPLS